MKKSRKNTVPMKLFATVITVFAMLTGAAQANVLFYQGFDYGSTEGNLDTVGSADWTSSTTIKALYNL